MPHTRAAAEILDRSLPADSAAAVAHLEEELRASVSPGARSELESMLASLPPEPVARRPHLVALAALSAVLPPETLG